MREDQFVKSLAEIKECFEKGKKVFNDDLTEMEKVAKKIRKSRRRFRAKQLTLLNQKELELEDMLSSSEEGVDVSRDEHKDASDENSKEGEFPKFHMALGGIPLGDNGEPLDIDEEGKWNYDYDDSDSLVLF